MHRQGGCLVWFKFARRSVPVFTENQIFAETAGISQSCQNRPCWDGGLWRETNMPDRVAQCDACGLMLSAVWVIILASSNGYPTEEAEVKLSIALLALLTTGFIAASSERAGAVVYCQYFEYPAGCVVRPGVEVAPNQDVRKTPPSIDAPARGFILRQDLFDRNNPNNLRSDWPGPRAQPGQF